ncbi:MAG: glycoside hydrolase family 25, partial [Bacilli bacterium]|nr:glycoside hydrolase family 25 [Bacilli bacterium]
SVALNEDKAREHAKWVIKNLNGLKLDFPIAYDWENWQYIREYNVSIHDLNMNFEAFADELKNNGYEAMLYSSKYYLNHIWNNRKDYPVWQAHYAEQTEMDKNGIMWQFSDKGRVPGITGNVDLDVYYLD